VRAARVNAEPAVVSSRALWSNRPVWRFLLGLLVVNALFLALAIWGAMDTSPGANGIAAGLAGMAAIVTAIPLVLAIVLWLIDLPRVAIAAGLLPLLIVGGFEYAGVVAERDRAREEEGVGAFSDRRALAITKAVAAGNAAALRDLAATGADLNARGPNGDTILTFTIFYWPDRVPLLLELGADPNLGAGPATGPLYQAAVTGKTGAVAALLQAGARPDVTDEGGTPVIFHTLKFEDPAVFDLFLEHGAAIAGRDDRGYTLLMAAAWHRHWREARLLLDRGLDPAAENSRGESAKTILDEAFMDDAALQNQDYRDLVARLAERGIEIRRPVRPG
jgi:hypothetical protein